MSDYTPHQSDKWDAAMLDVPECKCGRLDMNSYSAATGEPHKYVYWADGEETVVTGPRCDHVAYMAQSYRRVVAERDRLRAIVERLPVDAEGNPLTPGMERFTLATNEAGSGLVATPFLVVFVGDGIVRGTLGGYRTQYNAERLPGHIYSTREAAEAAKDGGE